MKKRLHYILWGLCWLCALPSALQANDLLQQADTYALTGQYQDALALYLRVEGDDAPRAAVLASRTQVMLGRYDDAAETCRDALKEYPQNAALQCQLAEVFTLTGQSREALESLAAAMQSGAFHVRSQVQYGKLLQKLGRRAEAVPYFERAVAAYNAGQISSAEDIAMTGVACWGLESWQDANTLFREAVQADPACFEAQVLWGDLFREKYNDAEAAKSYADVLGVNEFYVPALVGMAHVAESGAATEMLIESVLELNDKSEAAKLLIARRSIENDDYESAEVTLAEILDTNHESLEALTYRGVIAMMREEPDIFTKASNAIENISPNYGKFYADVANMCGRKYRFREAVDLAHRAIAADSLLWQGYTVLGMNLLRLGDEIAGAEALEFSFEHDPFNYWTLNMLTVLDTLKSADIRRTEHFIVRLPKSESEVLWPYMAPLLEEAWNTLTEKYAFTPEGPIVIEVFRDHSDFAVRTSGLPDIGPLVGVCFGKVITLDSPRALQSNGDINWQEIIWHEFMHVVTLQMTHNKMPRWLSEGVSVFEEHYGRPEWGRKSDLDLVRASQADRIIGLEELNSGFSKARTAQDLNWAYTQSALFVEYLVEQHGFEPLRDLIYQYAAPKSMADIIRTVYDQSLESMETHFFDWLDERVQAVQVYVPESDVHHDDKKELPEKLAGTDLHEESKELFLRRVDNEPRDFFAHLRLGVLYSQVEEYENALKHLTTARDILPNYSGYPNPWSAIAAVHDARGDSTKALAMLDSLATRNQHAVNACVRLANDARSRDDWDRASYYWSRAIAVNPYDMEMHRNFGQFALQRKQHEIAVREYRVLTVLDVQDPAGAHTDLAEALLLSGQKIDAKRAALAALEIAPAFERAQSILLQTLE
jgi:cellulose synthase operon protein C